MLGETSELKTTKSWETIPTSPDPFGLGWERFEGWEFFFFFSKVQTPPSLIQLGTFLKCMYLLKVLSIMQPTQILAGVWQYQSSTHGTYGYMTPERCHVTPNDTQ